MERGGEGVGMAISLGGGVVWLFEGVGRMWRSASVGGVEGWQVAEGARIR